MRTQLLVLFAVLIAQALAVPTYKAFTADLAITQTDKSIAEVTWMYDAKQNSEKVVLHRKGGLNTVNYRLYSMGVEFLFIEGEEESCYLLPLSDSKMPSPSSRASMFTEGGKFISWSNVKAGAVSSEEFSLPASCASQIALNGIFCPSCISISKQVINLGCNATAGEIANLCGQVFEGVCKTVLDQVCSGACLIEECAQDACCLIDLCTGDICNGSSSSSSSGGAAVNVIAEENHQEQDQGGIFCDSCVSVGKQVIALGCNATSDEIAQLCGNVFEALCKQILQTFCSGACNLEDCALDTCCLLDLCSGTQCSSNSTSSSGNMQPHRLVL